MAMTSTPSERILVYLLRRDLRLSDNPVFHEIANAFDCQPGPATFTHLFPIYVFPPHQVEISGFVDGSEKSPYPEARSKVASYWRCGLHRAKFLAESVWDLKSSLQKVGSDLTIRVGKPVDVIRDAVDYISSLVGAEFGGVWMTTDDGVEEKEEEKEIQKLLEERGKAFRLFTDKKYFVDDQDLPFIDTQDLPNVYTAFRKTVEPLRDRPRKPILRPGKLPPLPVPAIVPPQSKPFAIPTSLDGIVAALLKPLESSAGLTERRGAAQIGPGITDHGIPNVHPFEGGETQAWNRIDHLLTSGVMATYNATRNGLVGVDCSTKLSAYLAAGCISARQLHDLMAEFENGKCDEGSATDMTDHEREYRRERLARWSKAPGFGQGENEGTASVRKELLWRDYFHLCARKFGSGMFALEGVRDGGEQKEWRLIGSGAASDSANVRDILSRFQAGTTGIGLVDASQRELFLTGYTSHRARQNVASFFAKQLGIDWRIGAEWYEYMLVDYDAAINSGNWQYASGVGNDPRPDRQFNPIQQAFTYDPKGEYVRAWVGELRGVRVEKEDGSVNKELLLGVFQAHRLPEEEKDRLGLTGVEWIENPVKAIDFSLDRKRRPTSARGRGRGNNGGRSRIAARGRGGVVVAAQLPFHFGIGAIPRAPANMLRGCPRFRGQGPR